MASPDVAPVDIHARIHAFETLAKPTSSSKQSSKSSPNLLDTPNSPSSKAYRPIAPATTYATYKKAEKRSPSPSPPILGRKTSLIDLKDWVLDDGLSSHDSPSSSLSRTSLIEEFGAPSPPLPRVSGRVVSDSSWRLHSSSTPLINLDTTTLSSKPAAPPLPPRKASYGSLKSVSVSNSSSSSLPRSPTTLPLPLPIQPVRRKSDSLTVDQPYFPPSLLGTQTPRGGHVPATSISSFHSVSLSSDGGTDCTTPGSISNFVATYPIDREDTGSFAGDKESLHDRDDFSLDESYENVSASAISPSASSVSHDWGNYVKRKEPPKLPQRPKPPSNDSSSSSSSSNRVRSVPPSPHVSPPILSKLPPPPPPPRSYPPPPSNRSSLASTIASDRSSILSAATSRTSISSIRPFSPNKSATLSSTIAAPSALSRQISRPTPVPAAARRRYESVFVGNVLAKRRVDAAQDRAKSPLPGRKTRQAAGWRGLSVDLITNPEENSNEMEGEERRVSEEVGSEDRLDGRVVAVVWKASKLDREKLKEIWNDLDVDDSGSLSKEAFIQGMWRIDEELRKRRNKPSFNTRLRLPPTRATTLLL
ncbi:hypothetical protein QCA50_003513 [Cerrena zonata]|uniref:EF-hand domain-containing protein n=1 Tax=Cerrena zonata TaxID=2478898 RepID=A0AAW0GWI1_9APHY